MTIKAIKGSIKLGEQIRKRRIELNLTIEEAANRAGVGTKTWSRYESGESIRADKYKGLCRALNWRELPIGENDDKTDSLESLISEYEDSNIWPKSIAKEYGKIPALSFLIGCDLLLDMIENDLSELSYMPKGTHVGEISMSYMKELLPKQFLVQYDYDLLYMMKQKMKRIQSVVSYSSDYKAESVLEELLVYMANDEGAGFLEMLEEDIKSYEGYSNNIHDWIFDLFDDADIITFLYSDWYLTEEDTYHIKHWPEKQFYQRNNTNAQ